MEVVETAVANAYFLPLTLAVAGDISPKRLRRGIYQAVVYSGKLELAGQFARPDLGSLRIEDKDVLWDKTHVAFAIPDLRAVKETLNLMWGASRRPLLPGNRLKGFQSGVFANVGDLRGSDGEIPFQLELTFRTQ